MTQTVMVISLAMCWAHQCHTHFKAKGGHWFGGGHWIGVGLHNKEEADTKAKERETNMLPSDGLAFLSHCLPTVQALNQAMPAEWLWFNKHCSGLPYPLFYLFIWFLCADLDISIRWKYKKPLIILGNVAQVCATTDKFSLALLI